MAAAVNGPEGAQPHLPKCETSDGASAPAVADQIRAAKAGAAEAASRLLDGYREYLRLLAHASHSRQLAVNPDASDVVQDALMKANTGFAQFRGNRCSRKATQGSNPCLSAIQPTSGAPPQAPRRDLVRMPSVHGERIEALISGRELAELKPTDARKSGFVGLLAQDCRIEVKRVEVVYR